VVIGVDTNVLVRYLTRDDEEQCARVDALFDQISEQGSEVFVSDVVLVELVWVLERGYRIDRAVVAHSIESLLRTENLVFERSDLLWKAVRGYERSKADFADLLIAVFAKDYGCERIVTLDRKAARAAGMELL
jgi:predicted nucleic-acid-binding protein